MVVHQVDTPAAASTMMHVVNFSHVANLARLNVIFAHKLSGDPLKHVPRVRVACKYVKPVCDQRSNEDHCCKEIVPRVVVTVCAFLPISPIFNEKVSCRQVKVASVVHKFDVDPVLRRGSCLAVSLSRHLNLK